ncbi:hypothetical protein K491DRAFT_686838 [Lophiostoma macrostomum CBS 122681]|uniref:Post-SET domain-containing protein n=1 Tax=Lophiostoma macrostomum CBS 122681 TaxID=1314788 RepID=A0A6A6TRA3_9PLEO|nr:hypothetical protein K491DRAFT_686838 [Lophiostoma macrostomum CBS 122681]
MSQMYSRQYGTYTCCCGGSRCRGSIPGASAWFTTSRHREKTICKRAGLNDGVSLVDVEELAPRVMTGDEDAPSPVSD